MKAFSCFVFVLFLSAHSNAARRPLQTVEEYIDSGKSRPSLSKSIELLQLVKPDLEALLDIAIIGVAMLLPTNRAWDKSFLPDQSPSASRRPSTRRPSRLSSPPQSPRRTVFDLVKSDPRTRFNWLEMTMLKMNLEYTRSWALVEEFASAEWRGGGYHDGGVLGHYDILYVIDANNSFCIKFYEGRLKGYVEQGCAGVIGQPIRLRDVTIYELDTQLFQAK